MTLDASSLYVTRAANCITWTQGYSTWGKTKTTATTT